MKTERIGAGEFKAHCLSLIDKVGKNHMELIITKRGKPLAKLVPLPAEHFSLFGHLQGTVTVIGDLLASTEETWEADE